MDSSTRHKGHVKFFNSIKGFGFILPDEKQEREEIQEVFVHHTAIHNDGGFKSLAEGEQVEYDLVQGPKGMQASNVTGPHGVSVQGDPRAQRQHYPNHQGYRNNSNHSHDNRGEPFNSAGFMMDPYASPFAYEPLHGYPYMQQQPFHYTLYAIERGRGGSGGFHAASNSNSPQLQPQQYNGYVMYQPPNPDTQTQPHQFYGNNFVTLHPPPPPQQQQQQQQQQTIATPPQILSPSNTNNEGSS